LRLTPRDVADGGWGVGGQVLTPAAIEEMARSADGAR
jgi:hypothetical protein